MDRWTEIRTAYAVAKCGTVSAAAQELGVHRATVTRHIEALEVDLGSKLFQRHRRGYALTDVGRELLAVAGRAEAQISDFAGRARARAEQAIGDVKVTALRELATPLAPAFAAFGASNPGATVTFVGESARLRLERGEAHVAVRAGARPTEPDYVVQKLPPLAFGFYASRAYVSEHGELRSDAIRAGGAFNGHRVVGVDTARARGPFARWIDTNVPKECIAMRVSDGASTRAAVRAGVGLGFLPICEAALDPELVQALAPRREWSVSLWLLSHVDLHRTQLVQAMCAEIKRALGARAESLAR